MITLTAESTLFLYAHAADLRKGFDGLSGIVRSEFGREPTDGSYFLFVNRRRDRIKILHWEGDGLEIWYKRLERGSLELPRPADDARVVRLTTTELTLILGGVSLASAKRRKRYRRAA